MAATVAEDVRQDGPGLRRAGRDAQGRDGLPSASARRPAARKAAAWARRKAGCRGATRTARAIQAAASAGLPACSRQILEVEGLRPLRRRGEGVAAAPSGLGEAADAQIGDDRIHRSRKPARLAHSLPRLRALFRYRLAVQASARSTDTNTIAGRMENAFETALGLYRAGRGRDALPLLRELAGQHPGEPAILNLLGVCLRMAGEPAAAETALRAALAGCPDHADALLNLAAVSRDGGRHGVAASCLRRLLAQHPALREGLNQLGATLSEMGDLEGAERTLRRAVGLVPDGIDERFNLAAILCQAAPPDRAIAALRQAIALQPEGAFAYGLLGACSLRAGDLDGAQAPFSRALRLDPAAAEARQGLVRVARYRATARAARSGTGPDGLALRGAFATASGYSHMTRRLIEALRRQRIPLEILGLLGDERWPFEPSTARSGRGPSSTS